LIPNRLNAGDPFSHPSGSSAVSPLAFSLKASPSGPQSRASGIQKTFSAGPRSFSLSELWFARNASLRPPRF
jgi:hypothetical protein